MFAFTTHSFGRGKLCSTLNVIFLFFLLTVNLQFDSKEFWSLYRVDLVSMLYICQGNDW